VTSRRLLAPAKLNLSLNVVGRRADGMHELVSELVLLDLADELLLMPGSSGLRITGPEAGRVPPSTELNLAWRGLRAGLGDAPELACLVLEKSIPAAAGLGGGSSDAAAAWRLGRASRRLGVPTPDEVAGTAAFGADVPFFAAAVPHARVGGIGERVTALPAVAGWAVLAATGAHLPTAAVFAELRASDWSEPDGEPGRNDLLAPARRLLPEIEDLATQLALAGGRPHLTGSGPTMFTLTPDPEEATAIAGRLRRAGIRVIETRLRPEAATIEEISEEGEEG
jgi:4-diphosphocytidyl-2-C-methyl-D-erythritol kinase